MGLEIDSARRGRLVGLVQGFFAETFDEEISVFRAEQVIDFTLGTVGPQAYNQGVQDARKFLQDKLDDLDGEVHEPEGDR